jgi:hypothetical protein
MHSRRSGFSLVIAGLLCGGFFWLTDPRFGWLRPTGQNLIDAANQNWIGTIIGLAGSLIVLLIGLWLLSRRTV